MPFLKRKSDPTIGEAERAVLDARTRERSLQAKVGIAQQELQAALSERRSIMTGDTDGDDDALRKLSDRATRARDAAQAAEEALAEIAARCQAAEQALSEARDSEARRIEAARIKAATDEARKSLEQFEATVSPCVISIQRLGFDGGMVAQALVSALEQIVPEARKAIRTMEDYRSGLVEGRVALQPTKPPNPSKPEVPPIAKRLVFALEFLRWSENGEAVTAGRYANVELPLDFVATALAANLADEINSDRAAKLRATFGPAPALPAADRRNVDLRQFLGQNTDAA